jgi:hypothetical protein
VWEILADFDGWPQWNPFAQVKGRLGIGERLEVAISLPGKSPMTFRPSIVKLDPGRELRWLGSLGVRGLFDGEHGFRVVPEDTGRSRFEQFESFRGLLVVPILWKIEETTRTGFRIMNRALKAKAEAV